ncbi:hypothetical protein AZ044_001205 [Pluralibacter gergoviae]|nr:hypothetical protein AZ044_001205 [Pluralibacter gergoviae]
MQHALPLPALAAAGIPRPAEVMQAVGSARLEALQAVPHLQAQALQAWVDALNMMFRVAAAASALAGLAALWLIRPQAQRARPLS